MSSENPAPVVGGNIFAMEARQLPGEEETQRLHSLQETRGLEVFAPIELERVEGRRGLLVFTGSGPDHNTLWLQGERHHVDALGREYVRVVFEGKPLTPRFLIRATQQSLPATLAEWEARQAHRAAARERSLQDAERKRERLRKLAEPVTYDDVAHDNARMTLRQAGEIVQQAGGTLRVHDGRLIVSLHSSVLLVMGKPSDASKAAKRLYLAEPAVLATGTKRNGDIAVSKLPNKMVTPSGALAP